MDKAREDSIGGLATTWCIDLGLLLMVYCIALRTLKSGIMVSSLLWVMQDVYHQPYV